MPYHWRKRKSINASSSRTTSKKLLDPSACYVLQQKLSVRCGPTELSEQYLSKAQTIEVHSTDDEYTIKDRRCEMIVGFLSEGKHIPEQCTATGLCMQCLCSNPRGKKKPRKKSSSLPSQRLSTGSNLVMWQLEGKHTVLCQSWQ